MSEVACVCSGEGSSEAKIWLPKDIKRSLGESTKNLPCGTEAANLLKDAIQFS